MDKQKKCNHPTYENIPRYNSPYNFYSDRYLPTITCENCYRKKENKNWQRSDSNFRITFDFNNSDNHKARAMELLQLYENFDRKITDFQAMCIGRLGGASMGFLSPDAVRVVKELQIGFKEIFEKDNEIK